MFNLQKDLTFIEKTGSISNFPSLWTCVQLPIRTEAIATSRGFPSKLGNQKIFCWTFKYVFVIISKKSISVLYIIREPYNFFSLLYYLLLYLVMFKDRASLGRMPDGFLNLWFLYQNINGNSIILVFKKGKDPLTSF